MLPFASIISAVAGPILGGLLGGGSSPGSQSVQLTRDQKDASSVLLNAIQQYAKGPLAQSATQYGKQAAIADTQGVVRSIFNDFQNTALPAIYQSEIGSGGYNATTGQLLANDAFASTTNKAAATILDTIMKYRQTEQNDFFNLARLVSAIPGGSVTQNGTDPNNGRLWGSVAGNLIGAGVAQWNKNPLSNTISEPLDYGAFL